MTESVKCDQCGEVFQDKRGLTGHIRFVHEKRRPDGNAIRWNPIQKQIDALQQARASRHLKALQENEILAIELENKRMREELSGARPPSAPIMPQAEPDAIFKAMEILDRLQGRAEERILNSLEDEPAGQGAGVPNSEPSPEAIFMEIVKGSLVQKASPPEGATLQPPRGFPPSQMPATPTPPAPSYIPELDEHEEVVEDAEPNNDSGD